MDLENDAMVLDKGSDEEEEEEEEKDQNGLIDDPYEGMEFDSEQSARIFYNSYARRFGFSTRVSAYRCSRRDGSVTTRRFVCSKEGLPTDSSKSNRRRLRISSRSGCKAHLAVKKQASGKWAITKFVKEHNHELVPPDKVHILRSHRHISGPARSLIDTLQAAGWGATRIMSVLVKQSGGLKNVGFTKSDCQNYMNQSRQRTLGSGAQYIYEYLKQKQAEDASFFYAVQGGLDNSSGNVFWADSTCRMNYAYFGDTVTFDTSYRSQRYRVPFAPFTGINHHCQPVLFGCALLLNESEASFNWLFQNWLAAMSGRHPVSITTDHDRIIRNAIVDVFPGTRHRFCKSSIFREAQERLSHLLQSFPTLEADFQKCVNLAETIEEFEICWESLLGRYNLKDEGWLKSMYDARQHWVPIYLRDTFFAETSMAKTSDSTKSFFDAYIDASTSIHILISQYEKAIASRREKEVKAEYDTINVAPILKTPSPMEKQAANIYTKEIFLMFQQQLMETLAYPATVINDTGSHVVYQVAKFGDAHKVQFVQYNVFEKKASCSCQLFEFSGIPCRHVLAVFRVKNILRLPFHCVLKRWTRKAKSEVVLDAENLGLASSHNESFTARFESLSVEATKYVKEGADSENVYQVAMDALREASKKVAAAMCSTPALSQSSHMNKATGFNLNRNQADSGDSCLVSEDEKIQELTTAVANATEICEAYRVKLLSILRDMEEQKLRISLKVQSMRLNQAT